MGLDAVLFDLDGTLLDRRATFRFFLEGQMRRHAHLFTGPFEEAHVAELLHLDRNGMADRDEFYRHVEELLPMLPGGGRQLRADFEDRFPDVCVPLPGLTETLDGLSARGLRLGLITNGRVLVQSRKIRGLGLDGILDSIVISEATGFRKPDSRIFALALGELGVPAERAAYVGDNPEADVAGARASGLRAVWRRDSFWVEPEEADLIIDHLSEILPWVDEEVGKPQPQQVQARAGPSGAIGGPEEGGRA